MKMIIVFFIIYFSCVMLYSQEKEKLDIDTSICEGQFLYKIKFIPKPFYLEYNKITGYKFKIVNPNRKIQESDAIHFFSKPLRRLVFLLKKDNMYLLVAERGGFARGISCIYFLFEDGRITNMNFLNIPITEYDEDYFCSIIKSKKYTIDNNSIP